MEKKDAEVRQSLDRLAQALRAKDIDALMAHYAPDVVTFDVLASLQCRGVDAYRKNFAAWFGAVEGPIDYEMHDLQIAMGDEVAFCRYLAHVRTGRKRPENADYWADYWVRVTAGWQKRNGRWLIVHEHISIPLDMKTLHAASGLRP